MLSSWVSSIYLNCWNKCKIANSPAASSLLGPQSASQSYVQYIWPLYSIIYFRNLPPARPQLLPPAREHTPDILFHWSSWSRGSSLKYRPEILPTVSTISTLYSSIRFSAYADRRRSIRFLWVCIFPPVCHSLLYFIFGSDKTSSTPAIFLGG